MSSNHTHKSFSQIHLYSIRARERFSDRLVINLRLIKADHTIHCMVMVMMNNNYIATDIAIIPYSDVASNIQQYIVQLHLSL